MQSRYLMSDNLFLLRDFLDVKHLTLNNSEIVIVPLIDAH